jgi:hypothetical protein
MVGSTSTATRLRPDGFASCATGCPHSWPMNRDGYTPDLDDRELASTPSDLGLWIDTSDLDPDATVEWILARSAEAVVR